MVISRTEMIRNLLDCARSEARAKGRPLDSYDLNWATQAVDALLEKDQLAERSDTSDHKP